MAWSWGGTVGCCGDDRVGCGTGGGPAWGGGGVMLGAGVAAVALGWALGPSVVIGFGRHGVQPFTNGDFPDGKCIPPVR